MSMPVVDVVSVVFVSWLSHGCVTVLLSVVLLLFACRYCCGCRGACCRHIVGRISSGSRRRYVDSVVEKWMHVRVGFDLSGSIARIFVAFLRG